MSPRPAAAAQASMIPVFVPGHDGDLALGVERDAVVGRVARGDRLAQVALAVERRVAVHAGRRVSSAAARSASIACGGGGRSGLPRPRSMKRARPGRPARAPRLRQRGCG